MATCAHDAPRVVRACTHLFDDAHAGYVESFTGRGVESELLCNVCAAANDHSHLVDACAMCRAAVERAHEWIGIAGVPEVVVASQLALVRDELVVPGCPRFVDLVALRGADRNLWLGVTAEGALHELDLDTRTVRVVAHVPRDAVELAQAVMLHVSENSRFAAVVNRKGAKGVIVELATGRITMRLVRDNYHADVCVFPLAFVERAGRTLVVHSPLWNRLDVNDAETGKLLTVRDSPAYTRGASPPHYLDYFHCGLAVSPGRQRIADGGWVWAPSGILTTWNLERWLTENVWESEDGPSRRALGHRDYEWDAPMCWLDDTRLILWGYGQDDDWMIPAAIIFDTLTGTALRWFAGVPEGELVLDRQLIALAPTAISIWDVERGARMLEASLQTPRYHPSAKCFISLPVDGRVTVVRARGHHATARWNTPRVRALAAAIADDLAGLPVLADALEAAGCDDAELLAHCREPGAHGAHCWVLAQLVPMPLT